jgi:hypothetical protein
MVDATAAVDAIDPLIDWVCSTEQPPEPKPLQNADGTTADAIVRRFNAVEYWHGMLPWREEMLWGSVPGRLGAAYIYRDWQVYCTVLYCTAMCTPVSMSPWESLVHDHQSSHWTYIAVQHSKSAICMQGPGLFQDFHGSLAGVM